MTVESIEGVLRVGAFVGVFLLLGALEHWWPKRAFLQPRARRWRTNLAILLVDIGVQRLTVGGIVLAAGLWAQSNGFGVFNLLDWPWVLEFALGFAALDWAVWAQHVLSHKWPLLWRLHEVHHADEDVDSTTGVRFHPLEILLSAIWKAAVVVALGIDPWVALLFEVVLNVSSIFTHANVALPGRIDRALRRLVCTPDMHRIHHSVDREEADSNYGFFLSIWDRMFTTLREQPAGGHQNMRLGTGRGETAASGLGELLMLPFKRRNGVLPD